MSTLTLIDTEESMTLTAQDDAAYTAHGADLKRDATALLATCEFMLTGYETDMVEAATGIDNGIRSIDIECINRLRNQFPREIANYINCHGN